MKLLCSSCRAFCFQEEMEYAYNDDSDSMYNQNPQRLFDVKGDTSNILLDNVERLTSEAQDDSAT